MRESFLGWSAAREEQPRCTKSIIQLMNVEKSTRVATMRPQLRIVACEVPSIPMNQMLSYTDSRAYVHCPIIDTIFLYSSFHQQDTPTRPRAPECRASSHNSPLVDCLRTSTLGGMRTWYLARVDRRRALRDWCLALGSWHLIQGRDRSRHLLWRHGDLVIHHLERGLDLCRW